MKRLYSTVLCSFLSLLASTLYAQDKTVVVSTLEWPPYTGGSLRNGGATTEVVRQAFVAAGYEVEVVYRPWKRAIDSAAKGTDDVIAYFPGYHCSHQEGFISSNPIGSGPLGLAENTDAPISWTNVDSLGEQQLKIGTVLGYANTDEFDKKVGTGWVMVVPSNDDLTNLKKLSRQRIDAVVIDKFVLEYLKSTEASLEDSRAKLKFDERPLEDKTLYLCFRDDETGHQVKEQFNLGLDSVDPEAITEDYVATEFAD
ncbi:substrate-binding periplasmic protein [Granulosicoccus sp. 3-233]|uniref:substrate-binding periplasmic protein n=1 Tax=Granulosicoccus sp. 3-233 TaxID=3417969 RepID=UPI003D342C65